MTTTKAQRSPTKTKANRRISRASTSKTSATKTSTPAADDVGLLVLGFDEQQKPCGARFVGAKPDLVAKAAQLMGLKVYKTTSPDVAEVAKKLPVGQLYATGRAFVPNVRQSLYSDVIVTLGAEPHQAAVGPDDDKASTPVARGLPGSWDEIAPGHLVIAQESLDYGWCEAIVLQEVNAPGADGGLAYGFNIVKKGDWKEGGGRPLVAFAYATRAEAIPAATQMRLVIEHAVDVRPYHD